MGVMISGIVFVHSIVIIIQSALITTTCIVAIVRGIAARTNFEVVSKSSFEILSGRIGVIRAVSDVMARPYVFRLARCFAYVAIDA
jgi:hypothetical protein